MLASVTEINQFSDCRRRWWFSRQHIAKVPSTNLWFGTAIHAGLEGYFKNGRTYEAAKQGYADYVNSTYDPLADAYGGLWEQAEPEYRVLVDLGLRMLELYVEYDHNIAELRFKPMAVERRVFMKLPGGRHYLTGRLDMIGKEIHTNMTGIIDHKTSGVSYESTRVLDGDEQLTGYAYLFWRLLKRLPDVLVYDVLTKKLPEPPRVLKDGSLSKDKRQNTTYEAYVEAIRERGENPDHVEYEEILEVLKEKGWRNFFVREATYRNMAQVKAYEARAVVLIDEMVRCVENPALAYSSPSPMKCPGCPFQAPCLAMDDGSDVKTLLEISYNPGNGYRENQAVRKAPA